MRTSHLIQSPRFLLIPKFLINWPYSRTLFTVCQKNVKNLAFGNKLDLLQNHSIISTLDSLQSGPKMNIDKLNKKAKWVRSKALEMCINAGRGHLGGTFSCTEILVALYYGGILKISPDTIDNRNRDRLIFSKGHAMLALYAILGDLGFFDFKELQNYGKNGTILGDHPDHLIPGIEVSSGSLGHGLGIACGLALSAKMNKSNFKTFAILGDGECNEGSVWEAAMFGHNNRLNNLIVIVD